jgi:Fe-S-cluster containining protein
MSINTLCDVWAQDLLEITFLTAVKNNSVLQNPATYTITPIDGGAPINVVEVQNGDQTNATLVWLVVTPPDIGKTYEIHFGFISDVAGNSVQPNRCRFIGRTTKQDSMVGSRPKMYATFPDAVLRKVLQAVGREDDLIGGSRSDYFLTPLQGP